MKEHPLIRMKRRLEEAENLLLLYHEGSPGLAGEMGWAVFRDQVRLFLDDETDYATWPEVVTATKTGKANTNDQAHKN
jgi:hypothetical protein